jgi:hypothetical protein
MAFGGSDRAAVMRYGFTLRQVDTETSEMPLPALATVDFSAQGAGLKLAGLPVWHRQYRTNQDEPAPAEGGESDGGWLSDLGDAFEGLGVGTGTAILAGGAAVALILLSTDADDDRPSNNGMNVDGQNNDGSFCVNDQCLCQGDVLDCVPLLPSANAATATYAPEPDWMINRVAGGMGDLVTR